MENHVSESDVDNFNFDYVIKNSGTVEELYEKLDGLVGNMIKGEIYE